jgi:FdhD protein
MVSIFETPVEKVERFASATATDLIAVEEPLEIQIEYGPVADRKIKSIAITMRTPGHDAELAVGFLVTEGIVRNPVDVELCASVANLMQGDERNRFPILGDHNESNIVRVHLAPHVTVDPSQFNRNFYTTSSCGVCGKSSLMALQTACPPHTPNRLRIAAEVVYGLPARLRQAQLVFDRTGGLHGAALFDTDGGLIVLREDVGRHNAVDKLVGAQFLCNRFPLQNTVLMLSGRASFELLQKTLMSGVSMVAAVGAPSSLAVQVAREFDIALIGFLRSDRFNAYHGVEHLSGLGHPNRETIS